MATTDLGFSTSCLFLPTRLRRSATKGTPDNTSEGHVVAFGMVRMVTSIGVPAYTTSQASVALAIVDGVVVSH